METIYFLFGDGKELNILQMGLRSIVVFFICLLYLRISGRRSFGLRTPLDNIVVMLLGTMLGRAIAGASPFFPVLFGSLIFVVLHRILGWFIVTNKRVARFMEGEKICLYENGRFIKANLQRALVSEDHILQGVRQSAKTETMDKIDRIYMERNGEISLIQTE